MHGVPAVWAARGCADGGPGLPAILADSFSAPPPKTGCAVRGGRGSYARRWALDRKGS